MGARPLHETLKHALSAHLVPSAEFATPGLGVLVIDDPECLKVKVKAPSYIKKTERLHLS